MKRTIQLALMLGMFVPAEFVLAADAEFIQPDKGVEAILQSQMDSHCYQVGIGETPSQKLMEVAKQLGLASGDQVDGVACEVAEISINSMPSAPGNFLAMREVAFRRAFEKASAKLEASFEKIELLNNSAVTFSSAAVVAQAEGVNQEAGLYQVALLVCRSAAIDKLWQYACEGIACKTKSGILSVEEWLAKNENALCGPKFFIDKNGDCWFLGATSRALSDPKSVGLATRKSKGTCDLFAQQLALRQLLGPTYNLHVSGLSKLYSSTKEDLLCGGHRYFSAYGIQGSNLPDLATVDGVVAREAEASIENESSATDSVKSNENVVVSSQIDTTPQEVEDPNTIATLKDFSRRNGLCIGRDVQNARIVQIGTAEIHCDDPLKDTDFYFKRGDAIKSAIAAGLVKIAAQLDFKKSTTPENDLRFSIEGATVLCISEEYDPEKNMYRVSALVTWSKMLEQVATSIAKGLQCPVPVGEMTLQDWLEGHDLTQLSGPRMYFDSFGKGWLVSSIAFRYPKQMMPRERTRTMDWVEKYLYDMLSLGSHAEVIVRRDEFEKLRTLKNEREIDELIAHSHVFLKVDGSKIRGVREMVDKTVYYGPAKENVRVLIYALNANLVANALK